jgi:hypothetical protein
MRYTADACRNAGRFIRHLKSSAAKAFNTAFDYGSFKQIQCHDRMRIALKYLTL